MRKKTEVTKKKIKAKPNIQKEIKQQLEAFEAKIKERDEKIEKLDRAQKNAEIGKQKFGASEWKLHQSGNENGYHRSIYVDINSMSTPRQRM